MQPSKKRLRCSVLEEYLKNITKSPEKIAVEVGASPQWVETVISNYKLERNLKLPLYITKSIDLKNVYYLFTETEEKKISVSNRIIDDTTNLTEYEMFWLYNEKGFS